VTVRLARTPAWTRQGPPRHHVNVPTIESNGARVSFLTAGRGPAVLLLQGAGVIGEGWRPQLDGLSDRFQMIALDNRGIGGSTAGSGELTIEAMAGDARAVMDALGIERFHVGGHSMGGLIAQEIALSAPQRILSLAFLCTFAHGSQGTRITPAMLLTALRMRIGTRAMRRNAFLELVLPDSYLRAADRTRLAERLRPLFGYDLAAQPPIAIRQVRAMARYDAGGRLARLREIPTLVVSASEDRIALPHFGRELAALVPGSQFVEISDAGHGVTLQRPAEVNELLSRHFTNAVPAIA
jgi:pimeloyl-ACP methyl ester carboxylesterase